jgi:phosphoadenosine phosphosulfate reductase
MNVPRILSAVARDARLLPGFDERVAAATSMLQRAASAHPGRIVQASSLGAEDMVVTDLIARHRLPIAVATLETGLLHAETLALVAEVRARHGIEIELHRPVAEAVMAFLGHHGAHAMYRSVALRKTCCALRKTEPLMRLLEGRSAWVTGLRREQSSNRQAVEPSEIDEHARVKLNPLADWQWADVWQYIARFDVPYNALHDAFFPSIGCAPCTRAVAAGEDFRAGRWWWEEESAKECGLHATRDPAPRPQAPTAGEPA